MKKHLCILTLSLGLMAGKILPAQTFEWLNPRPHGYDVLDIEFFDAQKGLMCGTYGTIYLTTDGGNTWNNISLATPAPLHQIVWINANEAIIVSKNDLYKSNDGGLNWSLLYQSNNQEFIRISFPESSTGYAIVIPQPGGQPTLAKTTDGGQTWVLASLSGDLRGLAFKNAQEGMIVAAQEIYYTLDGAQSIAVTYTELLSREWEAIVYAEDNTWVATGHTIYGEEARYLRTVDNGQNWQVTQGPVSLNMQIKKTPDGTLYAFGGTHKVFSTDCTIQISTNAGLSWYAEFISLPESSIYLGFEEIKAAGLIHASKGFVYAFQEIFDNEPDNGPSNILFAKNGGSWVPYQNNFFKSIYDIAWDNDAGWLGEYGFLAFSTDGGSTWNHLPHPIQGAKEQTLFFRKLPGSSKAFALSKVLGNFNQSGFEAFELTSLYASNDGGTTWNAGLQAGLASPLNFDVFNSGRAYLLARNCGIVWKKSSNYYSKVYGKAQLYVSDDYGNTWNEFLLPLDTMANMQFINADTGYIFGGGGTTPAGGYYMSEDQGRTWTFYNLNLPPILFGQMLSPELGFVASADTPGKVYWFNAITGSTDFIFECPAEQTLSDMAFTSLYTGYILCRRSDTAFIYSTSDGGVHWNLVGNFPYLKKLKVFSNLNGFAYGTGGRLLKLGAGYPVGLINEDHPASCLEIYPNPADRYISIPLSASKVQNLVKVEIFDAAGRQILTKSLVNPAAAQLTIDVSALKEGIYILKLSSENILQTGKLVIQR